ncbi:MAG: DNA methyltransferase [Pseudomonadota bacterium]
MDMPEGAQCLAVNALKPNPQNARTHSKKQIQQIAESIKTFGFNNPVLIDADNNIIAGHGRLEAAKLLELKDVPVLRIEHMSDEQKRFYVIADNQLALNAGWDETILAGEFEALLEYDFDVTLTGFDMGQIDQLIEALVVDTGAGREADDVPDVEDGPAITQPGDVWQIGDHRLICGDALKAETYKALMDGAKADMVFTDPPYNVPIDGHVSGLGKNQHSDFAMASGEMSSEEFQGFLSGSFAQMAKVSRSGSIHFICMDWRHAGELIAAGHKTYSELKNICVWVKSNGGMGSLYRSRHELVFVFKAGKAKHKNNVQLGKHGRNRTNVWEYAGANSFGETRDQDLALHPTVKPLEMVKDAILDCSNRGGIVLDAFGGSGTTLLAAHRVGRKGYLIEIDPAYCDVILRRCVQAGLEPVHVETGESFAERQEAAHVEG